MAVDVIWGPLSEQANRMGRVGSFANCLTRSGVISSASPSVASALSKMTRTWVEVSSIDTSVSIQRRLTTSTIANAARLGAREMRHVPAPDLVGLPLEPVGPQHPRRRVSWGWFGQHEPVSCQSAPQRGGRDPHAALI